MVDPNSDSDSDSDLEKITNALNLEHQQYASKNSVISMNPDNISSHSIYNQESASDDEDSDQELIDDVLKQKNEKHSSDSCESGWNALFADITLALVNNQNY